MKVIAFAFLFWPAVALSADVVYLDCRPNSDPEIVAFELAVDAANESVTYTDVLRTIKAEAFFSSDAIRFSYTHTMAGSIMNKQDFEIDRRSLDYSSVSVVHIAGQLDSAAKADAIRSSGRCEIKVNESRKI